MTRWRWVLSVVSLFAISSRTAGAESRPYTIDATSSRIVIHVGKAGLLGFAGHEHEILAPVNRGTLVVDPAHVEASSADFSFDARTVRVTGRGEPSKDVPKVQKAMVGPDCLDAGRFPVIRFVSRAISVTRPARGGYDVTVQGILTLHGVSREVTVPLRVDIASDLLGATGTMTLKQTDFGIKPISVAGVVKVKDEIQIDVRLIARRPR
jgi:polyisoprenoid-binding protein YceI